MALNSRDERIVVDYIYSLINKPSHFNSLRDAFSYNANSLGHINAIANSCGSRRGEKGSRLAEEDLVHVMDAMLASTDQTFREAGALLEKQLTYYKPAVVKSVRSGLKPMTVAKKTDASEKFVSVLQSEVEPKPALPVQPEHVRPQQAYNPYAAHAGTGRCPTCRRPF